MFRLLLLIVFLFTVINSYAQWVRVEQLPQIYITGIALNDETIFVAADTCIIFKSTDNGQNWQSINFDYNEAGASNISYLNGKIYVGTIAHGVYVSTDNGNSWNNKGPSMMPVSGFSEFKGEIYCSTLGDGVFVETTSSWVRMNNELPTYSQQIYTMTSTPNNLLISAGSNGVWYRYDFEIGKWIEGYFDEGLSPGMEIWKMIYDNGICYASARNRIFSSTNDGEKWVQDIVGTKNGTDRIMYAGKEHIYALTNSSMVGVWIQKRYKNLPAGSTWSNDEEFVNNVYAFDILEYDDKLFLATDRGLYIKPLSNTHVDYENSSQVEIFPNPTSDGFVQIRNSEIINKYEIFDITGRIVHKENINDNELVLSLDLDSGLYYVSINCLNGQNFFIPLLVGKY